MATVHWFADLDPDDVSGAPWQPCLETETGFIPTLSVWFKTKAECENWIREFVVGASFDGA